MKPELINPASFARAPAPYSQAVRVGNLVFLAGQVALDDAGAVVAPGDVERQTHVVLERVGRVLAEIGGDLANVVTATVYLTDVDDFAALNAAWTAAFGGYRPARTTVRADLVIEGLVVEVQAVAVVP